MFIMRNFAFHIRQADFVDLNIILQSLFPVLEVQRKKIRIVLWILLR